MKIFNSLSKTVEEFKAIDPPHVGMYTCGPTVYSVPTIGNFRTYVTSDILLRVLKANGFNVKFVMNLTDVGHLTGDNFGDADTGEDRLEKAAKKENSSVWDIAKLYTDKFLTDYKKLNLIEPFAFTKATDHIAEQIELVTKLEGKGLTYKIDDGIYFDTESYEKGGHKYGELSNLDKIKEGARVEPNPQKKNPRDFALWKFSPKGVKRDMEWDSPWGMGFPGWHIECSAMSMKYLGETFDIHVGGENLKSTHHPNEIAQSEGVTGKKFVNYWVHGAFLLVNGGRMGKSLGNAYTLDDIEAKGFTPGALRYFYLSGKYNEPLNFTWEGLQASQQALNKLLNLLVSFKNEGDRTALSPEKDSQRVIFQEQFLVALNNDLNTPQALATLWEVAKSNLPSGDKYDLILSFDEVLGLSLSLGKKEVVVPAEINELVQKRALLRKNNDFKGADEIREKIESMGYKINDSGDKVVVTKG